MKIDPVALGIMITLNVETGVVTPGGPESVRGERHLQDLAAEVIKGTIPFFVGDLSVLLLVIFFPGSPPGCPTSW